MKLKNQKLKSHNEQLSWWGCSSCCEVLFKSIFNCVGQFTIVQLKWKSSSQVGILTCLWIEQRKLILDLLKIFRLLTMAVTTYFWAGRLQRPISENYGTQLSKKEVFPTLRLTNFFPSNLQICRQCRRGVSIQCLESPTPSTTTTTTASTTSSSAAPSRVEIDPVGPKNKVVSRWGDQMEVANYLTRNYHYHINKII